MHQSVNVPRGMFPCSLSTMSLLSLTIAVGLMFPSSVVAQGNGFAGENPLTYGEMYRTFAREHGALVQAYDLQVKGMRERNATPGEFQQAYEKFMKSSLVLDTQYKQPVTQKLLEVTNERVKTLGASTGGSSERPGVVGPSTPISGSAGTKPGERNYRAGFADTDVQGGARAVDHLERVAIEMGLTPNERATLFDRRPGYTTVDNDLLITAHKTGRLDRVGSEAWHTQIQVDAAQPETYLSAGMQSRRPGNPPPPGVKYVTVRDHQTKAAKGFEVPASALLPGANQGVDLEAAAKLQGMVKGTLKAIDTAQLSDADLARLIQKHGIGETPAELRKMMNLLKGGAAITPDAVGLTPDTIGKFQSLCRDAVDTSLEVTRTQATVELDAHKERIATLEATGNPKDRREAQLLREEVLDSKTRMNASERAAATHDANKAVDDATRRLADAPETQRRAIQQEVDTARRKVQDVSEREVVRELDVQVQRRRTASGVAVVEDLKRPPKRPFFPLGPAPNPSDSPPEIPLEKKPGFFARPGVQRVVGWAGQGVAIFDLFSDEFRLTKERLMKESGGGLPPTNREVLRNISFTRLTGRGILTLTGIEGAWLAGETAKYEWVQGTRDYIDAETERYTRIGYDKLPTGAAISITLKSTVRQVTLSTYQGAKGIPMLGDLVAAPENLFRLTESSIGVLYDRWKSEQILAENDQLQLFNERRAAIKARELLGVMRSLVADSEAHRQSLISLRKSLASLEADAATVRERFIADRTVLEALLAQLPPGTTAPIPQLPAGEELRAVQLEIEAALRETLGLTNRCLQLERDLQGGKIECAAIRAVDPQLHETRTQLLERYDRLQQLLQGWQQQLLGTTPAADAWRQSLRLQESLAWARDAARTLIAATESLPSIGQQLTTLHDNLELVREQVLRLHTKFSPTADNPRFARDWDDILEAQRRERIDPVLVRDVADVQREFRRAAAEIDLFGRTELPSFPAPPEPRRIESQFSENLAALETPFLDFGRALERTGELLDGLDQLCPNRPPLFRLRASVEEELAVDFTLDQERLPADANLIYSWHFGDEQSMTTKEPRSRHVYPRAGEYTVSVGIFQQTETVSIDLGEAQATVTLRSSISKSPPVATTGTERPWLGTSAAWFLEDVPRLANQSPNYLNVASIGIQFNPWGDELEATVYAVRNFAITAGDPEQDLIWKFTLNGSGTGRYDPQTGQFTLTFTECRMEDYLSIRSNGYPAKIYRPAVIQQTGINPDTIRWTGTLSGQLDWRNYKGTGRLDVPPLFKGRWEIGDWDVTAKQMIPPDGYGVRVPPQLRIPNHPAPQIGFYRSVEGAKRGYLAMSRTMHPFRRTTVADYGDEAIWSPQGGLVVRIGRWRAALTRPPLRTQSPEELRPFVKSLEAFVRNCRLEELLPEE